MSELDNFQKLANAGDPSAHYNLAICYASGRLGVTIDNSKAVFHFTEAVELGDADSAHALGIAYGTGKGVDQDYRQSLVWFEKAVELGKTDAKADVEKAKTLLNKPH